MKFSIGDKIVLKHTDEEGMVSAYISNDMVEVDVNGTTFPVHLDEIDHPYLKWFTEKKKVVKKKVVPEQLPVEKQKLRKPKLAKGIYLSFIPEFKLDEMEDVVDYFKVYLLNELPKRIQFKYEYSVLGDTTFEHEGKLHEFGHVFLHQVPFEDMNDQPRFNWHIDDLDDADMTPAGGLLKIKPQKVFQHIDHMLKNNEPSFNYLLLDDFKPFQQPQEEIIVPKQKPARQKQKKLTKPIHVSNSNEIDLHIENLTSDWRGMSNADIIIIQLSTLHDALRNAIRNRQDRLYIIHGVGKGKLRDEVHKVLAETPEVDDYNNDWHGRYGFGATEVRFVY